LLCRFTSDNRSASVHQSLPCGIARAMRRSCQDLSEDALSDRKWQISVKARTLQLDAASNKQINNMAKLQQAPPCTASATHPTRCGGDCCSCASLWPPANRNTSQTEKWASAFCPLRAMRQPLCALALHTRSAKHNVSVWHTQNDVWARHQT
jgi:hypothetical protein